MSFPDPASCKSCLEKGQHKITEYVRAILEHYKQKDPIGLPGVPIPDPMDIPPLTHSFSMATLNMKNITLYGLSKFRIHHVTINLAVMDAEVALTIDKLDIYGNYTLSSLFYGSQGPFTIKLKNIFGKAIARLDVERDGRLGAQEINMDISFEHIDINFERLAFFASLFQSIINSVGSFVFESIKPFILSEMNTNVRTDINKQVHKLPQRFPNSISPLDQLIAEGRKQVRNKGFEPYKVKDYNQTIGLTTIYTRHTWITGLSSFYRVGNVTVKLYNNSVIAEVEVGTQRLQGSTHWELSVVGGILSRTGTVTFSIEYLHVSTKIKFTNLMVSTEASW